MTPAVQPLIHSPEMREQLFSGVRKQTAILTCQLEAMQEQVDHLEQLLAMLSTPELPTPNLPLPEAGAVPFNAGNSVIQPDDPSDPRSRPVSYNAASKAVERARREKEIRERKN